MFNKFKNLTSNNFLKTLALSTICIPFILNSNTNLTKAAVEFQWNDNSNYKKLRWFQKDNRKKAKNTIFFFMRPSDRRTGFLKINIKVPNNFKSTLKEKKISLCQVIIGGFERRTKCIKEIPADIELSKDKKTVDIYPLSPLPSDKESYAVVFKIVNPQRSGLYQFHSFGQSSGKIPVSTYIGSYTIKISGQ